ncbi:MAG: 50S ribosomal protein L10 [Anaerolineae bacterium]
MPLTRQKKEELVEEYRQLLRDSGAVFFAEYSGLDNRTLTNLRNVIRDAGGRYKIVKLTLMRIALDAEEMPIPEMMSGVPLALIFTLDNIPDVAKALNEFAEANERVTVRGGIMGPSELSAEDVEALEDMPTLDDIRAQILGMLTATQVQLVTLLETPQRDLVGVLQAGTTSVLNVIQAYITKQEQENAA